MYLLVRLIFAFFWAMHMTFSFSGVFCSFAPCGSCGRLREAVMKGWGCKDFECCCGQYDRIDSCCCPVFNKDHANAVIYVVSTVLVVRGIIVSYSIPGKLFLRLKGSTILSHVPTIIFRLDGELYNLHSRSSRRPGVVIYTSKHLHVMPCKSYNELRT